MTKVFDIFEQVEIASHDEDVEYTNGDVIGFNGRRYEIYDKGFMEETDDSEAFTYFLAKKTNDDYMKFITPEVETLIKENKLLQAVKVIKEANDMSLKDAKDIVDAYKAENS